MENNKTELVFILDRSGSMGGLESDTIGGYNSMLTKQKELPGDVTVTTVLFDDEYELLHDRINLDALKPITDKEYYVRGCTALVDAIGKTIQKIVNVQKSTGEPHRAEKVIFVITTDGLENASREYSAKQIKKMISKQQEKYGWEFLFLGANIDAVETAKSYGIRANRSANYVADSEGVNLHSRVVAESICGLRSAPIGSLDDENLLEEIELDHTQRAKWKL
jgi:uncharacterized protein YegL